jgi:hypothetical protein
VQVVLKLTCLDILLGKSLYWIRNLVWQKKWYIIIFANFPPICFLVMKGYVKATKFMWYSWKNSIILEGFVHICIRKNVGVALKSKELRVCAMDVLGFLLVWFRMFWKKKKQENKTKQNKIEKWAHEETLVVAILPWGKSIFIIGFSYKIFRKQKWYAGSSKRGKKRAKGANVCVCVCVFVCCIHHTYIWILCCMYCMCCFVWQGITHQFWPHYCSGLKKS